jgi:retron-type reverse transcriptase
VKNKLTKDEKLKVLFDSYIEDCTIPCLKEAEYEQQFKSFKRLKSKKLPYIYDVQHFCMLTDSSLKQVNLFLSNKNKAYTTFKLPKKSGNFREINAPSKKMKHLQRWILDNILYKLNSGEHAHGFIPGKSISTNANVHVNQDLVLGIDIKDFFPSINFGSVYYVFKSAGYSKKVAWAFADLCTYHWKLPQGAPTSPMLANLVTLKLDKAIYKYCKRRNFNYSRYADDITISGSYNLPMHKKIIIGLIQKNGFTVNEEKTRMFSKGSRQKVTGLVVNDKVSIGKKRKMDLKAMVHNILINGPVAENRLNDPFFKERLFGHLGFANEIEPEFTTPLINALKKIDWSKYNEHINEIKESEINVNYLKRMPKTILIKFDDLGFFRTIAEFPDGVFNNDFKIQLNGLKEKCDEHGVEACSDCLDVKGEIYKKCMKYIIGHYTGTTGGHHHGHEIYDMETETDLFGDNIVVAFIMKSGKSNVNNENSIFRQVFKCAKYENIDLIAVLTNCNLNNELCEELKIMMIDNNKGKDKEQFYCLIMRNEMKRILYDFNQNIN